MTLALVTVRSLTLSIAWFAVEFLRLARPALALSVTLSALGAYLGMFTEAASLFGFASIGVLMWLLFTPPSASNKTTRWSLWAAFSLCQGAGLSGLIESIQLVDPSILITAFMGASVVFLAFSGAALFTKRRSYLYLGGALSSVLSWLFFGSLLNMFMRSSALFSVELYVGLAVMIGYVAFDTQMIVEEATQGTRDVIGHALKL